MRSVFGLVDAVVTFSIMSGIIINMTNNKTPKEESLSECWWRSHRFETRADNLVFRAESLKRLRTFFDTRGYVEVETPALQISPGLEPNLLAFQTSIRRIYGAEQPLYLHTSPEFTMKKLLAAGMRKIYQVSHVFRDGEWSTKHHPEFTLVEWYSVGMNWRELANEAVDLIRDVCGPHARHAGHICSLDTPWEFISVQEAFERATGIDLLATTPEPWEPSTELLRVAAESIGIRIADSDTWDDLFFRIFFEHVEPKLGFEVPTVLHSYPTSLAALSRVSKQDPRVAERFEIFVCGLELANGYGELIDAKEQRRRFVKMVEQRREQGRDLYPIDESFIKALEAGIPECSGIAMGFDRLVMLATGAEQIEDVLWAPVVTN